MAIGLLWKPRGLGSQEALGQLKRLMGLPGKAREGIGHTGILDPFAQGWLLVGTEAATKLLSPLVSLPKVYEAKICLGATTEALDDTTERIFPEGVVAGHFREWLDRPREMIEFELKDFLQDFQEKEILQTPPKYSAVRVDGERAYNLVRFQGKTPELKQKKVTIHSAEHIGFEFEERTGSSPTAIWTLRLSVSSGTYIRKLAQDWGSEICQFPGHLTELLRTQVGAWGGNAELESAQRAELALESFVPLNIKDLEKVFDIHYLTSSEAKRLHSNGVWKPRPHPRSVLLVGSLQGQEEPMVLAWTQAGSGRIGRVFKQNPLK